MVTADILKLKKKNKTKHCEGIYLKNPCRNKIKTCLQKNSPKFCTQEHTHFFPTSNACIQLPDIRLDPDRRFRLEASLCDSEGEQSRAKHSSSMWGEPSQGSTRCLTGLGSWNLTAVPSTSPQLPRGQKLLPAAPARLQRVELPCEAGQCLNTNAHYVHFSSPFPLPS